MHLILHHVYDVFFRTCHYSENVIHCHFLTEGGSLCITLGSEDATRDCIGSMQLMVDTNSKRPSLLANSLSLQAQHWSIDKVDGTNQFVFIGRGRNHVGFPSLPRVQPPVPQSRIYCAIASGYEKAGMLGWLLQIARGKEAWPTDENATA